MSSVWKLGSWAGGSIAVYRKKLDTHIFSNWFWTIAVFPRTAIIPCQNFLHGHIYFIWISGYGWKGNDIQSISKKIQISGWIGLQNWILHTTATLHTNQGFCLLLPDSNKVALTHLYSTFVWNRDYKSCWHVICRSRMNNRSFWIKRFPCGWINHLWSVRILLFCRKLLEKFVKANWFYCFFGYFSLFEAFYLIWGKTVSVCSVSQSLQKLRFLW